jgi:ATP-dependent Clp protease ATP-binding subunit ClpA
MELAHRVRQAINMSPGPTEQLLGNVNLRIRRDASVCQILAEEGYDEDLGARSLITAVKAVIEDTLVESYLDVDEEIREDQGVTQYVVDIRRGEVEVTMVPRGVDLDMGDSDGDD